MMNILIRLIATGCYTGYVPKAPGTAGSALAVLIIWALPPVAPLHYLTVTVLLIPVGIWAAGRAEKEFGHDGGPIVIDEMIGVFITCALVPHTPLALGLGFALFRLIDITKPFPVNRSQNMPGGVGVVIDDILAAIYAHLLLRAALAIL